MKSTWPAPVPRVGDPIPPIFHLRMSGVGVGGNTNFSVRVGGNANFSVFRYQHVGIPNVKFWSWGSKPTQGPNANGFASQWNIGFTVSLTLTTILMYGSTLSAWGGGIIMPL